MNHHMLRPLTRSLFASTACSLAMLSGCIFFDNGGPSDSQLDPQDMGGAADLSAPDLGEPDQEVVDDMTGPPPSDQGPDLDPPDLMVSDAGAPDMDPSECQLSEECPPGEECEAGKCVPTPCALTTTLTAYCTQNPSACSAAQGMCQDELQTSECNTMTSNTDVFVMCSDASIALNKTDRGAALAMGEGWVAVSAPGSGEVYLYERAAQGGWALRQTITGATTSVMNLSQFGRQIAMSRDGETLAISALVVPANTARGIVLLFRRTGSQWRHVDQTVAPGLSPENFGKSLALTSTTLAVGQPSSSLVSGSAHVYGIDPASGKLFLKVTCSVMGAGRSDAAGSHVALLERPQRVMTITGTSAGRAPALCDYTQTNASFVVEKGQSLPKDPPLTRMALTAHEGMGFVVSPSELIAIHVDANGSITHNEKIFSPSNDVALNPLLAAHVSGTDLRVALTMTPTSPGASTMRWIEGSLLESGFRISDTQKWFRDIPAQPSTCGGLGMTSGGEVSLLLNYGSPSQSEVLFGDLSSP